MTSLTEQQRQAVMSVDENVLVSAGAGSGKTHVLVERYIQILRSDPSLTIDGIIAVTFTRKAAGEMRTRLKTRFKQLAEQESQPERWRKCLADIDAARIGTIHSLCESILKAFPAEAGVDPQFEVIDEVTQAELLQESVETTFREVIGDELPEMRLLAEQDIEKVKLWLAYMLKSGLQIEEALAKISHLSNEELCSFMNQVRHHIQLRALRDAVEQSEWRQAHAYLAETIARDKLEQMRSELVQASHFLIASCRRLDLGPDDSAELWRQLDVLAGVQLRAGGRDDESKAVKARMKTLREIAQDLKDDPILPPTISKEDSEAFANERHLISLYARASAIYREKKRAEFVLDYNDLITLAHQSLQQ